ncbi:hypothetical protein BU24DRAFT_417558 [Aaosphaeria arxii CBS 175.79]|uniref:Uncharacterized protein n=1 Tax=Aaosphaeria arxii CBS 175.79 TaxID=1450172 RepID=A0A6A5YAV8_9PLEO|nr:uncharacterized protein BU24DRAFT_417558 [Aaosphaeria arxii CBS 175.79]KAF2021910.1 hypothetical protein BU24DRAFT_417558 [Aaosphaeria arxii CBS 175.79]
MATYMHQLSQWAFIPTNSKFHPSTPLYIRNKSTPPVITVSDHSEQPSLTHTYIHQDVTVALIPLSRRVKSLPNHPGRGALLYHAPTSNLTLQPCTSAFLDDHTRCTISLLEYFTTFYPSDTPQMHAVLFHLLDTLLDATAPLPHTFWDHRARGVIPDCDHAEKFNQNWKAALAFFNHVIQGRKGGETGNVTGDVVHHTGKNGLTNPVPFRLGRYKCGLKPWAQWLCEGSPGFGVGVKDRVYLGVNEVEEVVEDEASDDDDDAEGDDDDAEGDDDDAEGDDDDAEGEYDEDESMEDVDDDERKEVIIEDVEIGDLSVEDNNDPDNPDGPNDAGAGAVVMQPITQHEFFVRPPEQTPKSIKLPRRDNTVAEFNIPMGGLAVIDQQVWRARDLALRVVEQDGLDEREVLAEFDAHTIPLNHTTAILDAPCLTSRHTMSLQPMYPKRTDTTPRRSPGGPIEHMDMKARDVPVWMVDEALGRCAGEVAYEHPGDAEAEAAAATVGAGGAAAIGGGRGSGNVFWMVGVTVHDNGDPMHGMGEGEGKEGPEARIDWGDLWDDWLFG